MVGVSVCPSTVIIVSTTSSFSHRTFPRPPLPAPARPAIAYRTPQPTTANHVRYRVCHRERRRRCVRDDPHGSRPDQEGRVSLVFVGGGGGLGAGYACFPPYIGSDSRASNCGLIQLVSSVSMCRAFSLLSTKSSSRFNRNFYLSALLVPYFFRHPVQRRPRQRTAT